LKIWTGLSLSGVSQQPSSRATPPPLGIPDQRRLILLLVRGQFLGPPPSATPSDPIVRRAFSSRQYTSGRLKSLLPWLAFLPLSGDLSFFVVPQTILFLFTYLSPPLITPIAAEDPHMSPLPVLSLWRNSPLSEDFASPPFFSPPSTPQPPSQNVDLLHPFGRFFYGDSPCPVVKRFWFKDACRVVTRAHKAWVSTPNLKI